MATSSASPAPPRFLEPDFAKGSLVLRHLHHHRPHLPLPRVSAIAYLATVDHLRRYGRLLWQDNFLPFTTGPCPSIFAFYLRALHYPATTHQWTVPDYEHFFTTHPTSDLVPKSAPADYELFSSSDHRVLHDCLHRTDLLTDQALLAHTQDLAWQAGRSSGLIGLDHLLLLIPESERTALEAYVLDHTPTWTL